MLEEERGYSLIELMLAITVIGLLAAVAAPKVSHVLAVSRSQKVAADLQMLDAAVVMYEVEHGSLPKGKDIGELKDYVEQIDSVRPPAGSAVIVNGTQTSLAAEEYELTKGVGTMRATWNGKYAEAFLPSRGSAAAPAPKGD